MCSSDLCRYLNESLLRRVVIDQLRPGDIVLLRLHLTSKSYVRYPSVASEPSPAAYDQAIRKLAFKISERGAKLVLVGPNPNLSTQEMMALNPEWFNAWNRAATIPSNNAQETQYYHQLDQHLRSRSGAWEGLSYVSLTPLLCDLRQRCDLIRNNKFLYEDDHHLSPYGHDLIVPALLRAIDSFRTGASSASSPP